MTPIVPQQINPSLTPDTLPTIRQALAWAVNTLNEADIPDSRLSAEVLMGAVLELDRVGFLLAERNRLSTYQCSSFQDMIRRRSRQEPVAYITGHKEFWSLDFEVNPAVLIPRPETELLVEEALKWISRRTVKATLVELGTGSGAVAVSLAKTIPGESPLSILATDIAWPALQTAAKNAERHGLREAMALVQGNWLEPFSHKKSWIDLLISNPPYISEMEPFHLPATVKEYEPVRALWGGRDGLEPIRKIFGQAGKHLKKGGRLILEMGEKQGEKVLELAAAHKFTEPQIRRDYSGKDRIFSASYHG
jgi:release factor glutamine methyltransferase